MAWERLIDHISILVVDDDVTSLNTLASLLTSWKYKVLTANSAINALETLREFEGFFDFVITELQISGISAFEFQRLVKDEFNLPVILVSGDRRKSLMSNSMENGASHFMLKPLCADDFRDLWQHATADSSKGNQINDDVDDGGNDNTVIHGANSDSPQAASLVNSEPKQKRKYNKRSHSQMKNNKEDQSEEGSKRSKIVWTPKLHNRFLMAIKHIGFDKVVPKKILEVMNVPHLTRENVASHLQKYRIFLKKVADRGIIEPISDRELRSRFASELPVSVIKDIQTSAQKLSLPVQRYLKGETQNIGGQGPIIRALHHSQASINSANATTTQLVSAEQLPNLFQGGKVLQNQQGINDDYINALKQLLVEKSSFGSSLIGANNHVHVNSSYNAGSVYPAFGIEHGLLTSSNEVTGGFKFGEKIHQDNGLLGNQSLSYGLGVGNNNMATLSNTNLPFNSALDYNSFGLLNGSYGTQNENSVIPLGQGNSALVQGGYASAVNDVYASEFAAPLVPNATSDGNTSGIQVQELPQQLDGTWNVAGNEIQFNAGSVNEGQANQVEEELSKLFLLLEDKQLLNETGENIDTNELFNSDFPSTSHAVQVLEEAQKAGDMIVPSTENNINLPNESTTNTQKSPSQGNDGFPDWEPFFDELIEDNVGIASNSITGQGWDMDLFETVFGTQAYTSG